MTSFFAQLFTSLQEHIKATVPEIRWIDQDLGQLEWYHERPAVSWPCVLIDFNNTTYDQESQQVQWGNATITFRLGFPSFSPSNSLAPQAVKEMALQYYELEQRLYVALQGYDGGGICQPMTRVNIASERREEDNFRVRVLTFTTAFEDISAMPQMQKLPRPPLNFDFED